MSQVRYVLRREDGFGLLYDRGEHAYVRLTPNESALLSETLHRGWSWAESALLANAGTHEAARAIASIKGRGYVDADGRFDGRVVELPACDGTYAAPLAAHIGLTTACNFACRHCYSSSGTRQKNELTRPEIETILDELAAIGCQQLVFGGGEPFLRTDLAPLIGRANALGLDSYVHTNASLITRPVLDALAAWPPTGLTVSLDGATEDVNDRVRGPGTFNATLAALTLLRDAYPPGYAISMTVTGVNAHDTVAMVELAHREGAKLLLLRPPFPAGNMLQARELMCDLETFWASVGQARIRASQLGLTINCPADGGAVLPTDFDGFGCIAGHMVLGITPTGEVTPCLNLPTDYVAGNVRSGSVLDVWRSGASFQTLRHLEPNDECRDCELYDLCRGGCRIRAIDAGRGEAGRDTWCYRDVGRPVQSFVGEGPQAEPGSARAGDDGSRVHRLRVVN